MSNVIVPELGEGITKAVVAFWHHHEGDQVNPDEDIVELVTDKATFNVSADCKGTLKKIMVQEGQEVNIGGILAVIE